MSNRFYNKQIVYYKKKEEPTAGVEPATSRLEVVRAIQLRHAGKNC